MTLSEIYGTLSALWIEASRLYRDKAAVVTYQRDAVEWNDMAVRASERAARYARLSDRAKGAA
jgi:hypothetical protein